MERYLLFDGKCAVCTSLARNIERETNGWLVAHSLRDPAIQRTLARARPEWRWEPTLLEIEHVRVLSSRTWRVR